MFLQFLKISQKIIRNFYVENLFKKLFPISSKLLFNFMKIFQVFFQFFSKCYPDFSYFYIYVKFLPSFLKNYCKIFPYSKINLRTPMFYQSFFKISSPLIIIRSYIVIFGNLFQENWKFSRNFIKIFQQFS